MARRRTVRSATSEQQRKTSTTTVDAMFSPRIAVPAGELVKDVLDRILEGLCRPLRLRIEQVLASHPDATAAYKIASLLQFYTRLVDKAVHAIHSQPASPASSSIELSNNAMRSPLLAFLDEMTSNAFKLFYDHLHDSATALLKSPPAPPEDLSVPAPIAKMLVNLKDVMTAFDGSLMMPLPPSRDPTWSQANLPSLHVKAQDREDGFAPILAAMVDPLVQACTAASESLATPMDRGMFMLNCLLAVQSALQSFMSFTKRRMELLDAQLDVHVELIVINEVRPLILLIFLT